MLVVQMAGGDENEKALSFSLCFSFVVQNGPFARSALQMV
jgi:hypothetical protein